MTKTPIVTRRSVLHGIAGSSAAVGIVGTASADEGSVPDEEQLYLVLGGGDGLRERIERAGFEVLHELAGGAVFVVQGPVAERDALRSIPHVSAAVENETFVLEDTVERPAGAGVSADEPLYDRQWDKQLTGAAAAHERATGDGATVAVIDSGVRHSHPDLESRVDADRSRAFRNGRVRSGVDEVSVAETPTSVLPFVPTRTTTQPVAGDVEGHGTHVAGVAAAARNGTGIVGMAPDADIVSLRAFGFRSLSELLDEVPEELEGLDALVGTAADFLLAIDYAAEIGADAVNLSLRQIWPTNSRAFAMYRRVIQYAMERGTVVVVAAGNDQFDLDRENYVLPADAPDALTVAATGPNDKRSYYSNYGNGSVDVAAPGGAYETAEKTQLEDPDAVDYPAPTNAVLSSVPGDIYGARYEYLPGTSMAAPQAAGLACLLRELDPDLHPRRVQQAIAQGAVDLSGEYTDGLGAGRLDAPGAIDRIAHRL